IGCGFVLVAGAGKADCRKTEAIIFWRNTRVASALSQITFWRGHFWRGRFFTYPINFVRIPHAFAAPRARTCREPRGWTLYHSQCVLCWLGVPERVAERSCSPTQSRACCGIRTCCGDSCFVVPGRPITLVTWLDFY